MHKTTRLLLIFTGLLSMSAEAQLPLASHLYHDPDEDGHFYFYTTDDDKAGYIYSAIADDARIAEAEKKSREAKRKAEEAKKEAVTARETALTAKKENPDDATKAAAADEADMKAATAAKDADEAEKELKDAVDQALDDKSISYLDTIPNGFGGMNFGGSTGGAEVNINLVRYNLHYSAKGSVPFYVLLTERSENIVKDDQTRTNLLGLDSGLVNIKIANDVYHFYAPTRDDDKSQSDYGNGLCDFRGSNPGFDGGCYLNMQIGAKVLDYIDGNQTKYYYAPYLAAHFTFEMPVSRGNVAVTRAGRLLGAFGISAFYSSTDDVALLFPEITGVDKMDRSYASFDAGIKLTLDNYYSITAKYSKPLSNEDVLEPVYTMQISYEN